MIGAYYSGGKEQRVFKMILMSFDGSELATHALPYATARARAAQGRLVLTYALAPWELSLTLDSLTAVCSVAHQGESQPHVATRRT